MSTTAPINTSPNPPSNDPLPTRKVLAGGVSGALATLIVYVINAFVLPTGHPVPADAAVAFATILSFVTSYMIPSSNKDSRAS